MSLQKVTYGFIPTSIPNCAVWLDGADPAGTGIVPSAGSLSTWTDKSGSANNAIAYTGATAPSYSPTTSNVTFGTNYYYIAGISSAPATETVFMVLKRTSSATNTPYGTSVNSGATWYMDNTNPSFIAWNPYGNPNSSGANLLFYNNVTNVVCGTNSAGTNVMYLNGTGDTAGSTSFSSGGIMTIGISSSGVNGAPAQVGFVGTISEVIYYNSILSVTQRQQVEAYLAQKWSATSSLPANHPGRNTTVYRADYQKTNIAKPIPYYLQFSPKQIAGCIQWLDGADNSTIYATYPGTLATNSAVVTQWNDKSGAGNHVYQNASSKCPTFTLTSNALNFAAGAGLWNSTGYALSSNVSFFTVMISPGTGWGTWGTLWGHFRSGGHDSDIQFRQESITNGYVSWHTNNNNNNYLAIPTAGTNVMYSCTMSNGVNMFLQNSYSGSTTSSTYTEGAMTIAGGTVAPFWVGRSDSSEVYNGYICEIVYYNQKLSDAQRQQVESYLAQKWGLTASLPSGHQHFTQQAGAVTTTALSKFKVTGLPRVIVATGGTITTVGSYRFHTFTYPGGTFIVSANPSTVQALVVGGGGGGGGYYNGGGGGAGGAIFNSAFSVGVGSYTVTIGNGGAGASGGNNPGINGTSGGATTFSTLTGNGGGGGGADNNVNGLTGGCGGGMGPLGATAPGSGNQGYAGGYGTNGPNMGTLGGAYGSGYGGGGGGGMGSVGSNALTSAGPGWGGTGFTYVVGGQNYLVAGGGGGGTADTDNTNFGLGGSSIGGAGGLNTARVAGNGAANTGSGGGGYGRVGTGSAGGSGGTGIVVIAYRIS